MEADQDPKTLPCPHSDDHQGSNSTSPQSSPRPSTEHLGNPTKTLPSSTLTETIIVTVTVKDGGGNGHAPDYVSPVTSSMSPAFKESESGGARGHLISDDAGSLSTSAAAPGRVTVSQTLNMISASGGAFLGSMGSLAALSLSSIVAIVLWRKRREREENNRLNKN